MQRLNIHKYRYFNRTGTGGGIKRHSLVIMSGTSTVKDLFMWTQQLLLSFLYRPLCRSFLSLRRQLSHGTAAVRSDRLSLITGLCLALSIALTLRVVPICELTIDASVVPLTYSWRYRRPFPLLSFNWNLKR